MQQLDQLSLVAGALAAILAVGAIGLLLRANVRSALNRRLAIVLIFEGAIVAFSVALNLLAHADAAIPSWIPIAVYAAFIGLPVAYLRFLALLPTRRVAWLRSRSLNVSLVALAVTFAIAGAFVGTPAGNVDSPAVAVLGGTATVLVVAASLFAIVSSVSVVRTAPRGTAAWRQARAFATAFILRDALWIITITGGGYFGSSGNATLGDAFWASGPAVVMLAYVPIMVYGILRYQLFDIDIKIKVGIQRSTVVTMMLVVALAVAKTAEFYLNRTYGWIAGGVAAGAMLVLAPRLNKIGEKVASTAMPKVENSPKYVEFRKMEVYKAAVESALEGGAPTPKERATLDRLRVKLGIAADDAKEIETDVAARLTPSPSAPDGALA